MNKIAIIGGGPSAFFTAINIAKNVNVSIEIFEKSSIFLHKLSISGGGRCNITNNTEDVEVLSEAYPRGGKFLKYLLKEFGSKEVKEWFIAEGLRLKVEKDGRIFPYSEDSASVVNLLIEMAKKLNIKTNLNSEVLAIKQYKDSYTLEFSHNKKDFNIVVVASGGKASEKYYSFLQNLSHKIIKPIPSIFSFTLKDSPFYELSGLGINANIKNKNLKLNEKGVILFTHKGISGPLVLRVSSILARVLHELDYKTSFYIDFVGFNEEKTKEIITKRILENPKKSLKNIEIFDLPKKLMQFLLDYSKIDLRNSCELGKDSISLLSKNLCNFEVFMDSKNANKDEFVTCGGIALKELNAKTLESKLHKNIYFCGEVLDIDGITGGYNLQNAWSSGFIVAKSIYEKVKIDE